MPHPGSHDLLDNVGSVTAITNASAEVVWKSEYQPFGTTAGIQGTYEFDGGYTGKDVDDATGLIYMWHRWQDPSTGSFVSEDPAQDGNNWYSYCGGNPISRFDPTGLQTVDPTGAGSPYSDWHWGRVAIGIFVKSANKPDPSFIDKIIVKLGTRTGLFLLDKLVSNMLKPAPKSRNKEKDPIENILDNLNEIDINSKKLQENLKKLSDELSGKKIEDGASSIPVPVTPAPEVAPISPAEEKEAESSNGN